MGQTGKRGFLCEVVAIWCCGSGVMMMVWRAALVGSSGTHTAEDIGRGPSLVGAKQPLTDLLGLALRPCFHATERLSVRVPSLEKDLLGQRRL